MLSEPWQTVLAVVSAYLPVSYISTVCGLICITFSSNDLLERVKHSSHKYLLKFQDMIDLDVKYEKMFSKSI